MEQLVLRCADGPRLHEPVVHCCAGERCKSHHTPGVWADSYERVSAVSSPGHRVPVIPLF